MARKAFIQNKIACMPTDSVQKKRAYKIFIVAKPYKDDISHRIYIIYNRAKDLTLYFRTIRMVSKNLIK